MATSEGEPVFLDTNILVYAAVSQSPRQQPALRAIRLHHDAGTELWVSRQVLREYIATSHAPRHSPGRNILMCSSGTFPTFRAASRWLKIVPRLPKGYWLC